MPKTRPPYPKEFRDRAVDLARNSGKTIEEVANDLGCPTKLCATGCGSLTRTPGADYPSRSSRRALPAPPKPSPPSWRLCDYAEFSQSQLAQPRARQSRLGMIRASA